MATELTNAEELALQKRDYRVEAKVRATLDELRLDAREATRRADVIEAAVRGERWWELKGLLDEQTIESLCNISPSNLLGEG